MTDPGLDWSHQTLYTTGEPVSLFDEKRRPKLTIC